MLSDAQKREIEKLAAEQLRRNWGVVKARPLAAALDDIRARCVEEAWFSLPLNEVSNHLQRVVAQHELYGRMEQAEERSAELEQSDDREAERDGDRERE